MSKEWKQKELLTQIREDKYYDRENDERAKKTFKEMAKSTLTTIEKAAKRIGSTDL